MDLNQEKKEVFVIGDDEVTTQQQVSEVATPEAPAPSQNEVAAPQVEETPSEVPTPQEVETPITEEVQEPTAEPTQEEEVVEEAEEPVQESEPTVIDAAQVMALFEALSNKFDRKIATDEHKNGLFDKMYAELRDLREDPYRKTMKPIFMDLILFCDSLKRLVSKYDVAPSPEEIEAKYKRLRSEFSKISNHIEDILYNHGVEGFESKMCDDFNPKLQQAKVTTPTENDEENRKVVESLTPGYYWDEQLLRKETVHIKVKETK